VKTLHSRPPVLAQCIEHRHEGVIIAFKLTGQGFVYCGERKLRLCKSRRISRLVENIGS